MEKRTEVEKVCTKYFDRKRITIFLIFSHLYEHVIRNYSAVAIIQQHDHLAGHGDVNILLKGNFFISRHLQLMNGIV